jgi:hypothetical protein
VRTENKVIARCHVELEHLATQYETYKNDPGWRLAASDWILEEVLEINKTKHKFDLDKTLDLP